MPELSALILCGGIGLTLGLSWRVPGTRARGAAVAEAGRAVVRLVVVATLLVVCAAPLEGFVAPLGLPVWAGLSIAAGWILALGGLLALALRHERTRGPTGRLP